MISTNPSRSERTSLATAVTNITKLVAKNNFGPSTYGCRWGEGLGPKAVLLLKLSERGCVNLRGPKSPKLREYVTVLG